MPSPIAQLRQQFLSDHYQALVIPSWDIYHNEYPPAHARALVWACGFTGSNGILLITSDQALLFTDGRYLLQAELEVGTEVQIIDMSEIALPAWCATNLQAARIAIDGTLLAAGQFIRWKSTLSKSNNKLELLDFSYVNRLWDQRPVPVTSPLYDFPAHYAGHSSAAKLTKLREFIHDHQLTAYAITDPAEVCWLLNIRGADVPFTPIALLFAIVTATSVTTYAHNLNDFVSELQRHPSIGYDPDSFPALYLPASATPIASPLQLAKACKNPAEIAAISAAHRYDGLAVSRVLYQLATTVVSRKETDIAAMLLAERQQQPEFIMESFATIAGFASNGAIIHYHAQPETAATISAPGLLLLDSGGQYQGGTTDITRVVCFGSPSAEQIHNYTLVLKGHISLAMAVFPHGTTGQQLDVLARQPLWQEGKDFAHGTGHGVGCSLSVHEGPQRISKAPSPALKPGMVLSNEPGFYLQGHYGIRIENLMTVVPHANSLAFHTLTLAPYCRALIEHSLLNAAELRWLNAYHARVYNELAPLTQDNEFLSWLKNETAE